MLDRNHMNGLNQIDVFVYGERHAENQLHIYKNTKVYSNQSHT